MQIGMPGHGAVMIVVTLFLGVIAVGAAAVIVGVVLATRSGRKECPNCAEFVKTDAKVCRFCGGEVR